ncbi:MAG: hypothetical protein L0177_19310 [Chloroflexi bacterium]|nr:hypothetical protein [Chloroflexota bacterium]
MNNRTFSYTGNGAYCFSNSLHMCLSAISEEDAPTPSFIECLTTMPFGCAYIRSETGSVFFPSSPLWDPEKGLDLAIETLGWQCILHHGSSFDEAAKLLRSCLLDTGPVLIGPLTMACLTYNPNHQRVGDADHYVVGLSHTPETLVVHDPAGYPWASLPFTDFEKAWLAENLSCAYKRGPFSFRSDFQQIGHPSRAEMQERTIAQIRERLSEGTDGPVEFGNAPALRRLAEDLREREQRGLNGMLAHFSLPLAARRSTDAAMFLENSGLSEAASIQVRIAKAYGRAASHAAGGQWRSVADVADDLAELQTKLAAVL